LLVFIDEWDCSDGSDEQWIFIMNDLSEHNSKLMNLIDMKQKCHQQYRLNNTPFSDICNISFEYPCFRTDVDNPFNFTLNRPCINITQIGDGKIDCLSGFDERNRLQCSNYGMLGFHFQLDIILCVPYPFLCTTYSPWALGANLDYDSICFYQKKQFKNGTISDCNSIKDVMCLNDICIKNARCNGKIECLHGEDEYRCITYGTSELDYRFNKKEIQPLIRLNLPIYPLPKQLLENNQSSDSNVPDQDSLSVEDEQNNRLDTILKSELDDYITTVYEKRHSNVKSVYDIVRNNLPNGTITFEKHYLTGICNRSVAVKYYTGHTVCFCPQSFYGSQCEFYSDRVTVLIHLDLTNYHSSLDQIEIIKILVTFLFKDQIIDYYEFYVNPQLHNQNNYVSKQLIFFVYPRTKAVLNMKKNDRNGTQLYSIRFEAFDLYFNETIHPIGVWHYPIYFDFLPSFRLSKILRFHPSILLYLSKLCTSNPCGSNGNCQEIINSNDSSYFCSCHSGYYGIHCEFYDEKCNNYCSSNSICKPKYHGNITGNQKPLCLCPASTFGNTCHLKNDHCRKNPCLNGGTCTPAYNLVDISQYICLCTDSFEGSHCQFPRSMVNIIVISSSNPLLQTNGIIATTISYNDYDEKSLRLIISHQQVYNTLPTHLQLRYTHKLTSYAPTMSALKVYGSNYRDEEPQYYILYFYPLQEKINITVNLTSENYCTLIQPNQMLSKLSSYNNNFAKCAE
jgi:hypothetical protein